MYQSNSNVLLNSNSKQNLKKKIDLLAKFGANALKPIIRLFICYIYLF